MLWALPGTQKRAVISDGQVITPEINDGLRLEARDLADIAGAEAVNLRFAVCGHSVKGRTHPQGLIALSSLKDHPRYSVGVGKLRRALQGSIHGREGDRLVSQGTAVVCLERVAEAST